MDYYQVKPKNKPEVRGCVVARLHDEMRVLVGENSIKEMNLSIDSSGEVVSSEYYVKQISPEEMAELREDYQNFVGMQPFSGGAKPSLASKTSLNGLS